MTSDFLREFFLWCSILNGALLLCAVLICSYAGDWVYRMHTRWFPIPRDAFNVAIYCFIGAMKIFVIMFNLVPYLALVILD